MSSADSSHEPVFESGIIDSPTSDGQNDPNATTYQMASLSPPNISNLSINSDSADTIKPRAQHPLLPIRSVSDTGPPRLVAPRIEPSHISGNASPLAAVQAARSGRPRSSSGSPTSGSLSGVSQLPAGMQAKMMAVLTPDRPCILLLMCVVSCISVFSVFIAFNC